MTHRFPIKEIALQASLGTATVDRVTNNRAHVSPQTRLRVSRAIAELERQEEQIATAGQHFFFDFIIEAPARFRREVKAAAEAVSGQFGTAVCRLRFTAQDIMSVDDVTQIIDRIVKRGSHGICIKARDVPEIRSAINRAISAGIPVLTLMTDIQGTQRACYIGLDNIRAGQTAAFLIGQAIGDGGGTVLATRSHDRFLGEEEREIAFAEALKSTCPHLRLISASSGGGVRHGTIKDVERVVGQLGNLRAVYSMGGGNKTILDVLDHHRIAPQVFVAHDLDRDNRVLIDAGRITYILNHDLRRDLHGVFATLLRFQNFGEVLETRLISPVQIIAPTNVPDPR